MNREERRHPTEPGKPDAIEKWITSGLRYVELPSGIAMRIRLPSAERMLRSNTMPADLREMAVKFASTGIALEALDAEALDNFLRMKQIMVADSIREIYGGDAETQEEREADRGGWEPVTITAADLEEFEIDPDDLSALSTICMRQATVNMITLASRRDRGLLDAKEAEAGIERERGETVPSWGEFRTDDGGAQSGSERAGVERAPEQHDPDHGSRRGDRVRRGARS